MSIDDVIQHWIDQGELFPIRPILESDPVDPDRAMAVSKEINELLTGPWSNKTWERRCGRLKNSLETFVKGQKIYACLTPYEAKTAYMGRLDKPIDEVWDIRSTDPNPGLRVLGRFAKRDCFIAFTCWPRSRPIDEILRPILGPADSREWAYAINECKSEWKKHFPTYDPVHGDDIHDYISNVVLI